MRQFDRRLAYHFDWLVVLLTLAVAGIGLVTIYSATVASEHNGSFTTNPLVIRQAFYAGIGLVGMIAAVFFDYRRLERYAYVVYVLALIMLVAVPVMGSVGAAIPLLWGHLKPYQQQRVMTFLSPEMDPLGAGYHVIQSKIAIGSGMFWGKGYLHGTQNKLNFLPEQHTDFIFSVFSEEWGYVGALVLLALYAALVLRGLQIAYRAKDRFGSLLAFGIVAIVFWQVVINVGMTSGILPVVGIPLPFVSYGGSSLTSMMIALGLVINVNMRRFSY